MQIAIIIKLDNIDNSSFLFMYDQIHDSLIDISQSHQIRFMMVE